MNVKQSVKINDLKVMCTSMYSIENNSYTTHNLEVIKNRMEVYYIFLQ